MTRITKFATLLFLIVLLVLLTACTMPGGDDPNAPGACHQDGPNAPVVCNPW